MGLRDIILDQEVFVCIGINARRTPFDGEAREGAGRARQLQARLVEMI